MFRRPGGWRRWLAATACVAAVGAPAWAAIGDDILRQHRLQQEYDLAWNYSLAFQTQKWITDYYQGQEAGIGAGEGHISAYWTLQRYRRQSPTLPPNPKRLISIYAALDTPEKALRGLVPMARVGDYGLFLPSEVDPVLRQQATAAILAGFENLERELQKNPSLWMLEEIPYRRPELGDGSAVQLRARPRLAVAGDDLALTAAQQRALLQPQPGSGDRSGLLTELVRKLVPVSLSVTLSPNDQESHAVLLSRYRGMFPLIEQNSRNDAAEAPETKSNAHWERDQQQLAGLQGVQVPTMADVIPTERAGSAAGPWGRDRLYLPVLYVDAAVPRALIRDLTPLARVGRYGLLGPPGMPEDLAAEITYAFLVAFNMDAFQRHAARAGVRPAIGGPDEWHQLLARVPEQVPAPAPTAAPIAAAAAATNTPEPPVDDRGPPLPVPPPPASAPPGSGATLGHREFKPGLPLWPGEDAREKLREAQERERRFLERQAQKSREFAAWQKRQAREARERWDRNRAAFLEFARLQRAQDEARRRDRLAFLRSEEKRRDAVDGDIQMMNGVLNVVLKNRLTIALTVRYRWSVTIDGKTYSGRWHAVLLPGETWVWGLDGIPPLPPGTSWREDLLDLDWQSHDVINLGVRY